MQKIRFLLISIVIFSVLLVSAAMVSAESAAPYDLDYAHSEAGIAPVLTVAANTPKLNSVPGLAGFKCDDGENSFDSSAPGTYVFNLGGSAFLTVILSADAGGNIFIEKWESTGVVIRRFLVKGGNGYLTYTYDGSLTSDSNLYSPMTGTDYKNVSGISHISVFYIVESASASENETGETQLLGDFVSDSVTTDPTADSSQNSTGETSAANLAEDDLPLVSQPTDAFADSTNEASPTTVNQTTINQTTVNLTGEAIPRTGETDAGTGFVIGFVLMVMAAGLGLIVLRNKRAIN